MLCLQNIFILQSHRCWCELHREVTNYPRELRFYAKQRKGFQHKDEKVVDTVALKSDVIKVMPGIEYGIPESFKIVTSKAIYIFGTSTPEEAQSWAYAVWKELYGPVEPGVVCKCSVCTCVCTCVYVCTCVVYKEKDRLCKTL